MKNPPRAAVGHMPFPGHRTLKQVREDKERAEILKSLGEDRRAKKALLG